MQISCKITYSVSAFYASAFICSIIIISIWTKMIHQ